MDALFDTYAALLPRVSAWAAEQFPRRDGETEAAHARAVKAKALDLLRGLLPAASLSHMGIFATGQTYEQLILHLLAHPLPEAQRYGRMILRAVQATIPSFVTRIERPDRGGAWVDYLRTRAEAGARAGRRGWGSTDEARRRRGGPSVRLLRHDGDEDDLLAALLFEASGVPEERARARRGRARRRASARRCCATLVGARENRRHRPGRGFEALRYRFEIVSDYGAFRDLQRHRMLTVPVAGAHAAPRRRGAGGGRAGRLRRRLPPRARGLARASTSGCVDAGLRERRALRRLPRLPHPLRARHERARGDAADRAALRPRGPPVLPRRRARAARRRSPRSTPPSPPR